MLAAGIGAGRRARPHRAGGALAAVGFFIPIRGVLALLVGPVFGQTMPHFPLYLAEALVVEGIALPRALRGRPAAERPVTLRRPRRARHRHGRPRRRVGLVAHLGA